MCVVCVWWCQVPCISRVLTCGAVFKENIIVVAGWLCIFGLIQESSFASRCWKTVACHYGGCMLHCERAWPKHFSLSLFPINSVFGELTHLTREKRGFTSRAQQASSGLWLQPVWKHHISDPHLTSLKQCAIIEFLLCMVYISTALADYKVLRLITVHINPQASQAQRGDWVIRGKRWAVAAHESPHLGYHSPDEGGGDVIMVRDTGVDPSDRWACLDKREQLGHKGPI